MRTALRGFIQRLIVLWLLNGLSFCHGANLDEFPAPLDTLQNVTGTFKGTWNRTVDGKPDPRTIFSTGAGPLYFKLLDLKRQNASVHSIQGELKLEGAIRQQEDDVITFALEGVYVEESQHVHAIATTDSPDLALPIKLQDYSNQALSYRQGLMRFASQYLHVAEQHRSGALWPGTGYLPKVHKQCELVLDLKVSLPTPRTGHPEEANGKQEYILMNGTASSDECGIQLELGAKSTHLDVFIRKASTYTLVMCAVTLVQVWLVTRQIAVSSTQAQMSNTSMLMIQHQTVVDAFLCVLHLSLGFMVEAVFNAFAGLAFFEFVLFALLEIKYMLQVWRANRPQNGDMHTQQRELLALYIRFYLSLVLSIFLAYLLQRYVQVLVFGACSFWVPQIVFSAQQDTRPPLRPLYLWGMSSARLVLPLFLFGCPASGFGVFSIGYCILLTSWLTIQVLVLINQSRLGPRFFVPKRFLPPKYDYFRPLSQEQIAESPKQGPKDIETGDAGHECVICMNPLDLSTNTARMITPCNHYFHPSCLQRWMMVKMECPTCRSALPPE